MKSTSERREAENHTMRAGYLKEIFINKSNIKIQNTPPLHEEKNVLKTSKNKLGQNTSYR